METFADGGLFELAALLGALGLYKFISRIKWVKIVFSIITISCCVGIFILPKEDFYYVAAIIITINSVMLLSILWEDKIESIKIKNPFKHG